MDADVAPLPPEHIAQHPPRQRRVGLQHRRETPQQAVAIPVGSADIVARAAAGDHDELLGIECDAGGEEQAKKQIGIVQFRQLLIGKPGAARGPALAQHLLGGSGGRHLLVTEPPIEDGLPRLAGLQRPALGQTVGDTLGRISKGGHAVRVAGHRGKGKQRQAAAHLKDQAVVPGAAVAGSGTGHLLILVDTVPHRMPTPLQAKLQVMRAGIPVGDPQLPGEAPFAHRGQHHALDAKRPGSGGERRDPVCLPPPAQVLQR